jgi:hypothetical protein
LLNGGSRRCRHSERTANQAASRRLWWEKS